jgi:hypothetical protein
VTEIKILAPTRQYVGAPNHSGFTTETPTTFGSVSDDSDATYTRIEAQDNPHSTGVLTVDFDPLDPAWLPTAMVMQIRVKDVPGWDTNNFVTFHTDYWKIGDTWAYDNWSLASGTNDSSNFGRMAKGLITDPEWVTFYYLGGTEPDPLVVDGAWFPIDPLEGGVSEAAWDATTSTGLRFDLYTQVNGEPRRAYLDVYEVRLLLYCEGNVEPPAAISGRQIGSRRAFKATRA